MNDTDGGLDGRLAEGTHIKGTLKFQRALQIDGRFEGNVKSPGRLILGASAQVDADISVGELDVHGTLRGKVEAKDRLLIRSGGVVEGNIVAGKLSIESGAIFRGGCEMPEANQPAAGKVEAKGKPEAPAKPTMAPPTKPAPAGAAGQASGGKQ